jgi:hypothetical protein
MKNTDYIVYISTKPSLIWTYRKEKNNWTQTTPAGKVRNLSAEQLLSHLLPPLAKDQPGITVKVKRIEPVA